MIYMNLIVSCCLEIKTYVDNRLILEIAECLATYLVRSRNSKKNQKSKWNR